VGEKARSRCEKVGKQFFVGAGDSQGLLEGENHSFGLGAAQVVT
jgi:hypothetical protein